MLKWRENPQQPSASSFHRLTKIQFPVNPFAFTHK